MLPAVKLMPVFQSIGSVLQSLKLLIKSSKVGAIINRKDLQLLKNYILFRGNKYPALLTIENVMVLTQQRPG